MIGRGERAPDFALPMGGDERPTRFYGLVGGAPSVLVFAGGDILTARALAVALERDLPPEHMVFLVGRDPGELGARSFLDPEAGVHTAYGIQDAAAAVVLVLDRNVRVAAVRQAESSQDTATLAAEVAGIAADLDAAAGSDAAANTPAFAARHAPVLLVPDAVDDEMCDRLIAAWHDADPVATGVETMADGRHVEALDDLRKRRRDHVVTDPELLRALTSHVGRRVIPEVMKAFAFSARQFEGFKLGCYTADDAGFFAAHRDNLSQTTAHRQFALSINLNDDYEGGELCFPEYGPQRYRPERGEALVFSGTHLHEVRPVTRGRRFVLLSFLF